MQDFSFLENHHVDKLPLPSFGCLEDGTHTRFMPIMYKAAVPFKSF